MEANLTSKEHIVDTHQIVETTRNVFGILFVVGGIIIAMGANYLDGRISHHAKELHVGAATTKNISLMEHKIDNINSAVVSNERIAEIVQKNNDQKYKEILESVKLNTALLLELKDQ